MRAFLSIIVGLAIFIAMACVERLFATGNKVNKENDDHLKTDESWVDGLFAPALVGAMVGLINYFAPRFYPGSGVAFLAPISLTLMVGLFVYLIYWWHEEGSSFREMLPFIVMVVIGYFTMKSTALMTATLFDNSFGISLIMVIPDVLLVLSIGFFITNLFYFRYKERGESVIDEFVAIAAGILTALIIIFLICTKVYWGGFSEMMDSALRPYGSQEAYYEDNVDEGYVDVADTAMSTVSEGQSWYGFYNLLLQGDMNSTDDFNFGPNPYVEGAAAKDYDADLRARMAKDPALAAADMAWLDAIVGTRYLGEFYESCKGDWAKTINLTKERFMEDQGLYYQTLNAYFAFLDTADAVTLDYQTSDLDDQMYMNPKTVSGIPDVIVMTTKDHSGSFLTYTFYIKENVFRVAYRIDCGYQPTNVQKVMNIVPDDTPRSNPQPQTEPQPTPDPKPVPNPTPDPTPTPGGNGGDPTPAPNPNPTPTPSTPKKDPSQSPKTNTEPNDDPGPGPDTNSGVGSNTSTADQPTNSNHMTQPEYTQVVQELQDTNQNQKTGSDNNTPSVPAPAPDTHVDNNGDTGNGGAPINTPTPVTPPATVADTGQAISDSPGEAWGGPVD